VQKTLERTVAGLMDAFFGARPFPSLMTRALTSREDGAPWMDVLAFDYYDPFLGDYVDTSSFPRLRVRKEPWEWGVAPEGLVDFVGLYEAKAGGIPLHIVENGMAYACQGGEGVPRKDCADRVEVLKAHLFECIRARNRGSKLEGYFYWTLFDNYEWGSFTPRFGMLAVDYNRGAGRSPLDIVGNNAAGCYQAIVKSFLAKDRAGLKEAFRAKQYPLLFPRG
jgi:beta-glucosidase/6-phospho-beta-glucosidase/beta-galactosidase